MKTKSLVMLGSFLAITILIVGVTAYAYNAYCVASTNSQTVTMSASVNNWGLDNGYYLLKARVGADQIQESDPYGDNEISRSLSRTGNVNLSGFAKAHVTGWDGQGNLHSMTDTETH